MSKKVDEITNALEEIADGLPVKRIEVPDQVRFKEEAERKLVDYRFILSLIMVLGFLILLGIPLWRSEMDLLKTIGSILAGPVGAVLGYYFGTRKE